MQYRITHLFAISPEALGWRPHCCDHQANKYHLLPFCLGWKMDRHGVRAGSGGEGVGGGIQSETIVPKRAGLDRAIEAV